MAKAILKSKFYEMEKLESRKSAMMNSHLCPNDDHKKPHPMKTNTNFSSCDLLQYVPFTWSNTRKRTKHVQLLEVEHHLEEKHNLFHGEGKDLVVSSDQLNILVNKNLPIKKRKIHEIEVSESEEKYLCSFCPRTFLSYQALGGHIGHHGGRRHGTRFGNHQCCKCNKSFRKGQGLGGHKRHCNKGKLISTPLNHGLNGTPPVEDENGAQDTCSYT